eukprot:CAMPEP_0116885958 /NCGR_PEP_ID=MMETSP0463-20121206/19600_1 /TAXON_ID=181622 /ORGANISM="Strombidinopsis sp, Strain SopsisLIS2011" /LENGTH=49 /DNA_ID=CAMNT_0004545483 /DNA_START=260 /DNA_END=409 /DNA_ORIENTATION=+
MKKLADDSKNQFTGVKGELDNRDESKKGNALHHGYDTLCGNKGSKLSGG